MKKGSAVDPPAFAEKLLGWFSRNADIEDLIGDLKEEFYINLNSMSPFRAKLKYCREAFALIFSYVVKRRIERSSLHVYSMAPSSGLFLNYCRVALRSIGKNKIFFFVNISGLVTGMTAFLFITQYIRYERSYENFHEHAPDIWRVTQERFSGAELLSADCETYGLLGPSLRDAMPEVVEFVRMFKIDGIHYIRIGSKKILEEKIFFADSSIFDVFSLKVLEGDPRKALREPRQVVLTELQAEKLFDRGRNVLGLTVSVDNVPYVVSAVVADSPPNTHLKFNMLISHVSLHAIYGQYYTDEEWVGNNEYTYLLMEPGTDLKHFNDKLSGFSKTLADKIRHARFVAEPIPDIHLYSRKNFEPDTNNNSKTIMFLSIVAVFIIGIAWVNYINLSIAQATTRAREFAIRKVLGSFRLQLLLQFFSESFILNTLAGTIAFLLFLGGLPFFRNLSGSPVGDIGGDWVVSITFISLIIAGSLLACMTLPFMSSYRTSAVLRGNFQSPRRGQTVRKGTVVFQFAASIILVTGLCIVYLQIQHLRTYDTGMDLKKTMVLRAPDVEEPDSIHQSHFRVLKDDLLRQPAVEKVAGSTFVPGLQINEIWSGYFTRKGQVDTDARNLCYYFSVDADFVSLLNLKLVAGRGFAPGNNNDNRIILNEKAIKTLGFSSREEAVGSQIVTTKWKGPPLTIIGILKDFRLRSPKEDVIPIILRYSDISTLFAIKIHADDIDETTEAVQQIWYKVFGNTEFQYFFLEDQYNNQYAAEMRFGKLIALFSFLALAIASTGLFGLSVFTIIQRTKEIGIRKSMGASVYQIMQFLSWDFIKMMAFAAILGMPIAYFAAQQWLSGYAARIGLNSWQFIAPVAAVFIIALSAISLQIIKTARANPTKSLRLE